MERRGYRHGTTCAQRARPCAAPRDPPSRSLPQSFSRPRLRPLLPLAFKCVIFFSLFSFFVLPSLFRPFAKIRRERVQALTHPTRPVRPFFRPRIYSSSSQTITSSCLSPSVPLQSINSRRCALRPPVLSRPVRRFFSSHHLSLCLPHSIFGLVFVRIVFIIFLLTLLRLVIALLLQFCLLSARVPRRRP